MKKILICILVLTLLSSLAVFSASASFVTSKDTFVPVGEITVTWDANASERLDVTDGDMNDWVDAGYSLYQINPENMVSWVGGSDTELDPTMPANWCINAYFVADSDYLYIGFYTVDDKYIYADNGIIYNGDAFQLGVDFGGLLGQMIEQDPESISNHNNIFYSFSCVADGEPLIFVRQNADNDGVMEKGVTGAAMKTVDGWSAEFAISWQQMYDDFSWKAFADDVKFYYGPENDFYIGCALYYISRDDDQTRIPQWAACTGTGEMTSTPKDNGIKLVLPYEDDRIINCKGITNAKSVETEALTEISTEALTEIPTEVTSTDVLTETPTEAPTEAPTRMPETTSDQIPGENEQGCSSVAGLSTVALMTTLAVAFFFKKKTRT